MKRDTRITVVIIVVVLITILVLVLGLVGYSYFNSLKCDYNSATKSYIKKGTNCVINFLCIQGKKAFRDECGCGCEDVVSVDINCKNYSADNCPAGCVVCPPCEVCSSISCQTKEFCLNLGFNESWYDSVKPNNAKPNYCKASDRKAEVCIEIYGPVCGWFDSSQIKCIKFPCAQEFSNSCFACANENVLYWTQGGCPK